MISALVSLNTAQAGTITLLKTDKYLKQASQSEASAFIVANDIDTHTLQNKIGVNNIDLAHAKCAELFVNTTVKQGIHPTAIIDPSAQIAQSVTIGPYAVVEAGVTIGARTIIGPHVVLCEGVALGADCNIYAQVTCYPKVKLGNRVIVHSGAVLGSDGFGFAHHADRWYKIPQLAAVIIGDDVEIGANTTIDRGSLDATTIGSGVKIDNQVQIAHNVTIGEHSLIAGCCGIAGSVTMGKHCVLGGMVGIADHVELTDHIYIAGKTSVSKSLLQPGVYGSALPARPIALWRRMIARVKGLDSLYKRCYEMEKKINE